MPEPAIAVPLALALARCGQCHGYGKRMGRSEVICSCVYRRVFRDCVGRVKRLRLEPSEMARRPALCRGTSGSRLSYGFPNVEFAADLENSAKRILPSLELLVWKYHVLAGLDWRGCLPLIGRDRGRSIDRGEFFHSVYRMEHQLGRAWLELRIWPRDYFAGAWYMVAELLAVPHGPGAGSLGASQHTVLDARPPGWDNRKAVDPTWPGNFPRRFVDDEWSHRFTDRERQLRRVDDWMVALTAASS